jgi:hypothetical protein
MLTRISVMKEKVGCKSRYCLYEIEGGGGGCGICTVQYVLLQQELLSCALLSFLAAGTYHVYSKDCYQ